MQLSAYTRTSSPFGIANVVFRRSDKIVVFPSGERHYAIETFRVQVSSS